MINKTPLWRQTPLAVFPVCLGFLALAIGWRNAADILPWLGQDVGHLMLAASMGYFIWFVLFYLAKFLARPAVLLEDLRTPPARGGVAAMAMAMMILAAALLPLGVSAPQVWWLGVLMQIGASAVVLYAIWRDPPKARHFTTFQYLTFVGPVVGPIAGVPLGYVWQSYWLIMAALVAYLVVTAGIVFTAKGQKTLTQFRPSVTIFLAPPCVFALGFGVLGYDGAFTGFYWAGSVVAFVLLWLVPWMLRGGYTPVWAAFTFPIAAFLNVQVMAVAKGHGVLALIGVYAGLLIGTPVVVYLAYRTVRSG